MNLLRNFYRLAAPFWLTRQSWKAWLALGSAIACSLLFVQVVVLVARWQKARIRIKQCPYDELCPLAIRQ